MLASTNESGDEPDLFPRFADSVLFSHQRSQPLHHKSVMRYAARRLSMISKKRRRLM
jgi:hypothetical protein